MEQAGKLLIALGAVLMTAGVVIVFFPNVPFLGKLPGDIHLKKENFEVYIPIVSSLLLSFALSGVFWVISYFQRRGQ